MNRNEQFELWRQRVRQLNREHSQAVAKLEKPWVNNELNYDTRFRLWKQHYAEYERQCSEIRIELKKRIFELE